MEPTFQVRTEKSKEVSLIHQRLMWKKKKKKTVSGEGFHETGRSGDLPLRSSQLNKDPMEGRPHRQ